MFIAVGNRRHNEVKNSAIFGEHLTFQIVEVAVADQFLQTTTRVELAVTYAEEISYGSTNDFLSPVSQFLQPVISNGDDESVTIDGMQHCGCRPIQGAVFEVRSRLV